MSLEIDVKVNNNFDESAESLAKHYIVRDVLYALYNSELLLDKAFSEISQGLSDEQKEHISSWIKEILPFFQKE